MGMQWRIHAGFVNESSGITCHYQRRAALRGSGSMPPGKGFGSSEGVSEHTFESHEATGFHKLTYTTSHYTLD